MRFRKILDETVRRLPVYLRELLRSLKEGRQHISSQNLADCLGINSCQIRKDFSYFGDFGTRGVGYNVKELVKQISKVLRLNVRHKAALVGVGNLGSSVLTYSGFKTYGFDIVAIFDIDPRKVGKKTKNIKIENVSKLQSLKKRNINLGILAVPFEAAQQAAEALVKAGVKGILSFSGCHITVPKNVKVISIEFANDLARLPYYTPAN